MVRVNLFTWKMVLLAYPVIIFALVFSGCSGNSSDNDNPTGTALFVDNGIYAGIPYKCGDIEGMTDRFGALTYREGCDCTFTLGKLEFTAPYDKIKDGVVTVFDATNSKIEADALSAILQTVSYGNRYSNHYHTIDNRLKFRIAHVDLSEGDDAVAKAFAFFIRYNRITPITIEDAALQRLKYVNNDNELLVSKDYLNLLSQYVTYASHDNHVNFLVYDYYGPLWLNGVSMTHSSGSSWYSIDHTCLPDDSKGGPSLGFNEGDIPHDSNHPHVFGMNWHVGRKKHDDQANWFKDRSGGKPTIILHNVDGSQKDNTHFTSKLNFAYNITLVVDFVPRPQTTGSEKISIPNLVIGQGSGSDSGLRGLFKVIKDIGEIGLDVLRDALGEETCIPKTIKNVYDLVKDSIDLGSNHNVWLCSIAEDGVSRSQVADDGTDAIIYKSIDSRANDASVQIAFSGNDDEDHTFYVTFDYLPW